MAIYLVEEEVRDTLETDIEWFKEHPEELEGFINALLKHREEPNKIITDRSINNTIKALVSKYLDKSNIDNRRRLLRELGKENINDILDEEEINARKEAERKSKEFEGDKALESGKHLKELEDQILNEKNLIKREELLNNWINLRYPGIIDDKEVKDIIGQWVTSLGFKTPLLNWLYNTYKNVQNKNLLVAVNNTYSDGTLRKEDLLGTSISGYKHIIFHPDLPKLNYYNDMVYIIKIYKWAESEYDIKKYIKTNFFKKPNNSLILSFFNLQGITPPKEFDKTELDMWGITQEQAEKAFNVTKPSEFRNYLIFDGDNIRDPDDIMDDVDKLDDYIPEERELGKVFKQPKLGDKPSEQEVVDYFTSKGITQKDIKNLVDYSNAINRLREA